MSYQQLTQDGLRIVQAQDSTEFHQNTQLGSYDEFSHSEHICGNPHSSIDYRNDFNLAYEWNMQ